MDRLTQLSETTLSILCLTLEISRRGNLNPLASSNSLRNSVENLRKRLSKPIGINFDVLMVDSLLGVDPTSSYEENTKSPIHDFIDFTFKNSKN